MKTIYTRDNCPACVILKGKYRVDGVPFVEVKIGKDISLEDFKAKFPEVRAVPYEVEESCSHIYSRSMNQEYPRKCVKCGVREHQNDQ